ELDGTDGDSTRWLTHQEKVGVPVQLTGQHDLLLVASGKGRRGQAAVSGPDVELADLSLKAGRDGGAAEANRPVVRRLVVVAEDGALASRKGNHQAHAMAVLRHVGETQPPHRPRRARGI